MTDRHTADSITSDALDALYDQLDAVRDLHERWKQEGPPPAGVSMHHWWGSRLAGLELALGPAADELLREEHVTAGTPLVCSDERHAAKVAGLEQQLANVHALCDDLRGITGARWIADALDKMLTSPGPAAIDPHIGLVVQPYRNDRGEDVWVFRCWGTDDGCDGWLSLDHYSEQSATRARDRHVTEEHGPAGTEVTEEHNLIHALGGDRTAKTIAHTLTVHGHTLDAVRTMTDAELFAVPGIGGTSLARVRAALDGCPEPDATEQAEAERCCVCGSAAVVYHNHREQPFCWPCADCPCGQDACIRTGLHRTTAEKQADAQAQIAELERNNRALVKCAEQAGVRRDQVVAALREVLDAFTTARRDDGVIAGHILEGAIRPDDFERWSAVLNPAKERCDCPPTNAGLELCPACPGRTKEQPGA